MTSPVQVLDAPSARPSASTGSLSLILFCVAHFFVDLYSIGLSVLQPLLIDRFGLTLTQAGVLGGTLVFSSSVMQPVYGMLSDRFHTRLFTVVAPATVALFICSLGNASGYWTLLAMVCLGGAGVAAFHPQATANAVAGVETNRGRAMAVFISAGTLGMAVSPAYFSFVTRNLGLSGAAWSAVPGFLVTLLLIPFLRFSPAKAGSGFELGPLRAVWKPITILYFLVFIRSIVQVTFAQFLPLYLHRQRGYAIETASYITAAYLFFGAVGGFAGGNLADRFGGKKVILTSMIGSVPFLFLFVHSTGFWSVAGLIIGGLILLFTIPVNVVMGQELAPAQAGTVSALMMGFAWGMAGIIFIPLTGWVSEMYSMQYAFSGLILFPLLGFLLALKLGGR